MSEAANSVGAEVILKNKYGSTLQISAEGPDASEAIRVLAEVIESFDVDD